MTKRLTKTFVLELLRDESYIDALAYVSSRVSRFKTEAGQMGELERVYEKMSGWAYEGEDDQSSNLERIYSGVYMAIERDFS